MILFGGRIYDSDSSVQDRLLDRLEPAINETLVSKTLDPDTVISAISALGDEIAEGRYDELFRELQTDEPMRYKALAAVLLSRENLAFKLETELGETPREYVSEPPGGLPKTIVRRMPLGVIFHIAAGNADALPAFSLAEGLLTGNVNILKLPRADNGLSLKIISRLIELEPALSDFVYVFDTSSTDVAAMKRMAQAADGISVWGGEAAVRAVRALAPAGAKLIEWGHKLSFCYISDYRGKGSELTRLAEHIADTGQLLCSSCQTIFIDTDSMSELCGFCEEFLPVLEKAFAERRKGSIGERAYAAIRRRTELLEKITGAKPERGEYRARNCRLIARRDSEPELSPTMGAVLVKRLPKRMIGSALRAKKGFLQTAGLICSEEERASLCDIFSACGITRITTAGNMSGYFGGEAHDGEYPLRRYTRVVNIEIP